MSILLVEDDDELRDVIVSVLEEEGVRVHAAANGREALAALIAMPPPRLILLDWMMPEMNGSDVLSWLDGEPRFASIPVVVVSASPEAAENHGRADFLPKPINLDHLLDLVHTHAREG